MIALFTIVLCFTYWMPRTSEVQVSVSLMFLACFNILCDLIITVQSCGNMESILFINNKAKIVNGDVTYVFVLQ